MIKQYVTTVCQILNINEPTVSSDTASFSTETTLVQCDPSGSTIYLKNESPNPDLLFAIAHELRHVWQVRTNKQLYLSEYKPAALMPSIEDYNLQLAEIDANAFAAIIMTDFFRLQPQWQGQSAKVISAINSRIKVILQTLNI